MTTSTLTRIALSVILVGVFAACASSPSHTKAVARSDFGDQWPLTIATGTVECRNGGEVVFTASGTTYALNGTAKGADKYADINAIWADDPQVGGLRKNIKPLIDAGLALC